MKFSMVINEKHSHTLRKILLFVGKKLPIWLLCSSVRLKLTNLKYESTEFVLA